MSHNLVININYNKVNIIDYKIDIMTLLVQEDKFMKNILIEKIIKKEPNKISFKVKNKSDKKVYFLKIKLKSAITPCERIIYNYLINNKNIYIENIILVYENKYLFFILSDYISSHEEAHLEDIINTQKLEKEDILKIIVNTLKGLNFLHQNNIIHGDIKLENIMYNKETKKAILIDFDISRIAKNEYICEKKIIGTELYIAPESYDLKLYSTKSDIWSLGVCFYRLITKVFPYKHDYNKFVNFYSKNCFKDLNLELLNNYSDLYGKNIIDIIKNMLEFNDQNRMTCDNLIKKIENII